MEVRVNPARFSRGHWRTAHSDYAHRSNQWKVSPVRNRVYSPFRFVRDVLRCLIILRCLVLNNHAELSAVMYIQKFAQGTVV